MGMAAQVCLEPDTNSQTWVILRCASSETLQLVQSLAEFGIKAWSPIGRSRGRKPRSRSFYDKIFPLTSSYVFASASDLLDLERLSKQPIKGIPVFSVFYHCGEVPQVVDSQLNALRGEEQRLKAVYERQLAKGNRKKKYEPGHQVTFSEGAFAGLDGKVVSHKGHFALVSISGFELPIRVSEALINDC